MVTNFGGVAGRTVRNREPVYLDIVAGVIISRSRGLSPSSSSTT
ncbi:hypothetical protein [Glaciihabitans sp. UYNi722]